MNRKYQLVRLKPSMYKQDERIKANKTVAILKDYLKKFLLLDIGSSTGIMTNEYANIL